MGNRAKTIAVGTLVAGAMGYVAGILTAPKSGKETREDLRRTGSKHMREAEKQLKSLHTELSRLLNDAAIMAKEKGKTVQGEVIEKATKTKQKTREILSALHDGNAEDDDLDKAVDEMNKAISSIKTYLKK